MCGCSNFVNNDERDIITQDELSREFDFTGNRPSIIEVGEDPSFDFIQDIERDSSFDEFLGKKAKARRQERRALKRGEGATTAEAGATTRAGEADAEADKNAYGTSSWFSNNWIYIVLGVAVIGGGYYFYKKRK